MISLRVVDYFLNVFVDVFDSLSEDIGLYLLIHFDEVLNVLPRRELVQD
jgi:hypothetical protein